MQADVYVMSRPNVHFSGVVDSIGFGVTPDPDVIGRLETGLPDVQRSLNGCIWPRDIRFVCACKVPLQICFELENQPWSPFGETDNGHHRPKSTRVVRPLAWFGEFLKGELAPYPGRAALVARTTVAATLVMMICMTFRISYGFQGAIYALLITRESPRATLRSAGTILLVTGIGAAYLLNLSGICDYIQSCIFSGSLVRSSWLSMLSVP